MSDHDNMYVRLARQIDPADPAAGLRVIDAEIIRQCRARANAWNRHRLALYSSSVLIALTILFAIIHVIPERERALMLSALPWLEQPAIVVLTMAVVGLILFWITFNRPDEVKRPPMLPPAIAEALAACGGRPEYFVYWPELHWPRAKLAAHRARWFGFEFWRDVRRAGCGDSATPGHPESEHRRADGKARDSRDLDLDMD